MSVTTSGSELKARHRTMWASGDYPRMVETFLLPLGPRLVEACDVRAGQRVLDVAAGTGNASIPAAQRGAHVVASDLTPELLEAGRARPEAQGLDIDWVPADAEHLPFGDGSFDVGPADRRREPAGPARRDDRRPPPEDEDDGEPPR